MSLRTGCWQASRPFCLTRACRWIGCGNFSATSESLRPRSTPKAASTGWAGTTSPHLAVNGSRPPPPGFWSSLVLGSTELAIQCFSMPDSGATCVYRFKVVLREGSPMVWRRLLLRSDQSIADLHFAIQFAMGWSDQHLNCFRIHGKDYGVAHIGGLSFSDHAGHVSLASFRFESGSASSTNTTSTINGYMRSVWRRHCR